MAKIKRSIQRISGKLDGKVYVDSRRYGYHVRETPKITKPPSEAFTKSKERTSSINLLASELNNILPLYADLLNRSTFYLRLMKAFRKEPLNNRFLRLSQLKGMEIHNDYPLAKHSQFGICVKKQKDGIQVDLLITHHPHYLVNDADCYYYEVCLLCWDKSKKPAMHSRQLSDWVFVSDPLPEFEFVFPRPVNPTQWLLCVRVILGVNKRRIEALLADGMQIVDVGSFDKKEAALAREGGIIVKQEVKRAQVVEQVRVKAKKRGGNEK